MNLIQAKCDCGSVSFRQTASRAVLLCDQCEARWRITAPKFSMVTDLLVITKSYKQVQDHERLAASGNEIQHCLMESPMSILDTCCNE